MSEKVTTSGLLGHTFSHIIADQFARLKEADRFFYELGGQPGSFTLGMRDHFFIILQIAYHLVYSVFTAQLGEIRKSSMSGIFCLNSDGIKNIQPLAFRPFSDMYDLQRHLFILLCLTEILFAEIHVCLALPFLRSLLQPGENNSIIEKLFASNLIFVGEMCI